MGLGHRLVFGPGPFLSLSLHPGTRGKGWLSQDPCYLPVGISDEL